MHDWQNVRTAFLTLLLIFWVTPSDALVVNSHLVKERTVHENLDAKSLMLNSQLAKQNIKTAQSQYDPLLTGSFAYEKDLSERGTAIFGSESSQTAYTLGISQLTPTGAKVDFGLASTKETSDSAFSISGRLYDSRTMLSVSQPVLNNAFGRNTRDTIKMAQQALHATQADIHSRIMDLTYQNLITYWTWYLNHRLVAIGEDALSAAIRLHRTNRQKMAIGLIEESDIYAFAANVDLKNSDLLQIKANTAEAEGQLKIALNTPTETLTVGEENFSGEALPSIQVMIAEALQSHPYYQSLKHQLASRNIQVAITKNQRLPQIDLVGSLTLNGLDPSFDQSVADIGNGNPIWQGGINVSFPLLNRQAQATHQKSQIEARQLLYTIKNTENQIVAKIEQGYRIYQNHLDRMKVAATAVHHQKLKWEGEITKYDQGRSDPDIVIRYQNDYLDTQKLYVQAQIEFQLAALALDYHRGRLANP